MVSAIIVSVRVLLLTHESALAHQTPAGHPERRDRIPAAIAGVWAAGFEVVRAEPEETARHHLERIHDSAYIDSIEASCRSGPGALDPDTFAGPASWEAALRAAGAGLDAVAALERGDADTCFIAMRPPGHHAERARAMGFCLFNNVAVAAAKLIDDGARVAVVDFDVHHGNGTQRMFYAEPNLLYISLHEHPQYPGTGHPHELGAGSARGTNVNIPMPTGANGRDYQAAFGRVVLPVLRGYAPDWLLVSAGFDAHRADPLAGIRLEAADYEAMTRGMREIVPPNRTVSFLEGGYDLDAIRESVAAALRGSLSAEGVSAEPHWPVTIVEQVARRLADYYDL